MNGIHEQIRYLHQQINQIYQIIDQLSDHVNFQYTYSLPSNDRLDLNSEKYDYLPNNYLVDSRSEIADQEREIEPTLGDNREEKVLMTIEEEHKDILQDPSEKNGYRMLSHYFYQEDENVSSEDKVQRLTAQLTAAYHRIASLEEKLIAHRQHK